MLHLKPDAIYQAILRDLAPYVEGPPVGDVLNGGSTSYARQFAARELAEKFLTKWETITPASRAAAVDAFKAQNKKCLSWTHPANRSDCSEEDHILWNTFSKLVQDFFILDCGEDADLDYANIVENAKVGPGAAVGARGTSFYSKHASSPISATSQFLIDFYKADIWLAPEGSNSELIRQEHFGSPTVVRGSKTYVVPKNDRIARLVCVEPTINMFYQLGVGELISKRLKRLLGINIQDQADVNRQMAFQASMVDAQDQWGVSTLDLKMASDSLSLGLVASLLPVETFSLLCRFRSETTNLDGEIIDLNMLSTMGNGFTFPFQTAMFSLAVVASLECSWGGEQPALLPFRAGYGWTFHGGKPKPTAWSVFGDDIIVNTSAVEKLKRLLNLMGCVVNDEKSFTAGPFRESCGRDYYHGYNVRPVYLRKLKTRSDLVVILNLLTSWSVRTGIPLSESVGLILRHLPGINPVPLNDPEDSGWRLPLSVTRHLPGVMQPTQNRNLSFAYVSRKARMPAYRIGDGVVLGPRGAKSLIYNPSGLMMAYLRGEIRGGRIVSKVNGPIPYATTRCVTPNWDYVPPTVVGERSYWPRQLSGCTWTRYSWLFPLIKRFVKPLKKVRRS